jgi:hypothetical protein
MDELLKKYVETFGECVAIYAIPSDIEIDGKELTLDEFLKLCIEEKKLVTDYFPYKDDLVY